MSKLLDTYLGVVKKMIPEKNLGASIGLDIGIDSCKMVEIDKSADGYRLISSAIEPTDRENLKTALRKVLGQAKTPTKTPYTAVFGKGTLIRYIDMPRMGLDDLKKSLNYEADKYFPFAKEQIYTDCYILDPKVKDNKMVVLVAAAKKELVDERIQVLTELGLQPDFIGINPIAVANVINVLGFESIDGDKSSSEDKETACALIDMGDAVSNLMITVKNLPRFTRDVYVGGQEFNKKISNALDLSIEDAEKLKMDPGDKKEEVLNACESALTNLITEVTLSFDYFTTEYNIQVSKLYLTGGASLLPGLVDLFKKHYDIDVEIWNPLTSLELREGLNQEEVNKVGNRLGVALGLALYQYS